MHESHIFCMHESQISCLYNCCILQQQPILPPTRIGYLNVNFLLPNIHLLFNHRVGYIAFHM
ncbi:hypothetical protein Lalb_Chr12g0208551 [Lupinus albus]|uniref:Uncharacterized protein n=1 Tax=Lupinus albus TaxID=3870 RepID=A0A6A4PP31_LUPAL|nr:hypothetical protein Lalb_Chr12g0208551 [Lupinus albus]